MPVTPKGERALPKGAEFGKCHSVLKWCVLGKLSFDLYKIHPPKEEAKAIDFG
jgi:hypothetical protein